MIEQRLESLGFIIKRRLKPGKNRLSTQHRPNKRNGVVWVNDETVVYFAYDDTIEQGYFFINEHKYANLTDIEKAEIRAKYRAESDKIQLQEKQEKLLEVRRVFAKFNKKCEIHPYLERKKVVTNKLLKIDFYGNIIVPAYNIKRELMGYQIINEEGDKFWKTGSDPNGVFLPFMHDVKIDEATRFYLAEGYATACSVDMAVQSDKETGGNHIVISCFSSHNIDKVADILRNRYKAGIIAVKDNDMAGGKIKTLGFVAGDPDEDANDYMCKYGTESLKQLINKQVGNL